MPTLSQSPRTSRWLRRMAPSAERSSSSTAGMIRHQRTVSQIATGMRNSVLARMVTTKTARKNEPSSGRMLSSDRRNACTGPIDSPRSISTSARAVAPCTRPTPRNVSAVESAKTKKTRKPPLSPPVSTPRTLDVPVTRLWSSVTRTMSGTKMTPRPSRSRSWLRYIRAEAVTIWPQERRRASRSGAVGVQVAREMPQNASPTRIAITMIAGHGLLIERLRSTEPPLIAPQKKSVAPVPSRPPAGTA